MKTIFLSLLMTTPFFTHADTNPWTSTYDKLERPELENGLASSIAFEVSHDEIHAEGHLGYFPTYQEERPFVAFAILQKGCDLSFKNSERFSFYGSSSSTELVFQFFIVDKHAKESGYKWVQEFSLNSEFERKDFGWEDFRAQRRGKDIETNHYLDREKVLSFGFQLIKSGQEDPYRTLEELIPYDFKIKSLNLITECEY